MTAPGQQNPNAFLMGGGSKSAKFEQIGQEIGGRIVAEPELRQQTEYKTEKPKFWDNGDPVMQLVVKVQTDLREDGDDDGVRAFYIRGGFKRATTQKAVADACRAAGTQGLSMGGELFIKLESIDGTGQDAPKSWSARYTPPVVGAGFLNAEPPTTAGAPPTATSTTLPAPAAPQQAPAPVAPAPPAAAQAHMVTLPDGSVVSAEVAALLAQVAPQAASA